MPIVVQKCFPSFSVIQRSLAGISKEKMKSFTPVTPENLLLLVPTAHSVWIDIPRHLGTSDREATLKVLHEVLVCCRKYNRPLAIFKPDGSYFDNKSEELSPEWMRFKEANNVSFRVVCSCMSDDQSLKRLHWKRQVFSFNFPHTCPAKVCTTRVTGKVRKDNVFQYTVTLYEILARTLLGSASTTGNTGTTVPHDVQRVMHAEETERSAARPSPCLLHSDVLHTAQLSIDTHRSEREVTKRSAARFTRDDTERAAARPSITATQRLPDSSIIESKDTANPTVCFADALDKIATHLIAKTTTVEAYPTDSKEREKQRKKEAKERGEEIVVKKQVKPVENVFDDCGEDVSKLEQSMCFSEFDDCLACNPIYLETYEYSDSDDEPVEHEVRRLLCPFDCNNATHFMLTQVTAENIDQMVLIANTKGSGIDIAEVCGGVGRTTKIGIRRKLKCGPNFDLVCNCDLTVPADQESCLKYFKNHHVLVAILAPICGPFGPMSHLNWHLHPETMRKVYNYARPIAWVCGMVALSQLRKQLDFICEQPHPSSLYREAPWDEVMKYWNVVQVLYHRCRAGLKVVSGPNKGLYMKKPSTMTVSCAELGKPFTGLICDGRHEHLEGDGHPTELAEAQVWTWDEATRVMDGVTELKAASKRGYSLYESYFDVCRGLDISCYPVEKREVKGTTEIPPFDRSKISPANESETPKKGKDLRAVEKYPEPASSPCAGCRWRRPRDDWAHNRTIGECYYPFDKPTIWDCDACMNHIPRYKAGHTGVPGECRWEQIDTRRTAVRLGAHPREPRVKKHHDSTAGLPGTHPDHGELGKDGEDIVDQALKQLDSADKDSALPEPVPMQIGGASSSSSGAAPAGAASGKGGPRSKHAQQRDWHDPDKGRGDFDPSTLGRKPYGPRKQWHDAGTGPGNTVDWTGFDLRRVLQVFRSADLQTCKLNLRKLHLRWWHAQAAPMQNLLSRAGVRKEVIDLIPDIVDTCVACRAWHRPLPDAQASVSLSDTFNQEVECDLLFIYNFIIFHLIDRCIRWHVARLVKGKKAPDLIPVLDFWCEMYGPMKYLIVDGERGIVIAEETKDFCKQKGITIRERAPGMHGRYIERRGAMLRDSIHRGKTQCDAEGISVTFERLLSEFTFAGNAFVSVNGTTPYNALYGRTPNMLPGIEILNADGEFTRPTDGDVGRIREIAIQRIVEGTAVDKMNTAMNTRTLPAGEHMSLQVGDEVDYYRPPSTKDVSGWRGPAKVTGIDDIHHGIIKVKDKGAIMSCKCGDVRPHLQYWVFLTKFSDTLGFGPGDSLATTWHFITRYLETAHAPSLLRLGHQDPQSCQRTSDSRQHVHLTSACFYFVGNGLRRTNILQIRLGKGINVLPPSKHCDSSLVAYWNDEISEKKFLEVCDKDSLELTCNPSGYGCPKVNMSNLTDRWKTARCIQTLECSNLHEPLLIEDEHDENSGTKIQHDGESPQLGDLPTIIEEDSQLSEDDVLFTQNEFFMHEDPECQAALVYACNHCHKEYLDDVQNLPDSAFVYENICDISDSSPGYYTEGLNYQYGGSTSSASPISCYHTLAANRRADLPWDYNLHEDPAAGDIYYEDNTWKLLPDVEHIWANPPKEGEVVVFKVMSKSKEAAKRAVVQKDDDNLTAQEAITHKVEVEAAQLAELQTWAKYKCFSRKPRSKARNIIDSRWVLKWKWEYAAVDVKDSTTKQTARRVIRARLTIRGFKDLGKDMVDKYAGTSQRYSQRVLASEAVARGWRIATTDISKAFLQGVTYEELSKLTGEPIREVNFYLPHTSNAILKQVEGFETFNPMSEVLHCDKPGTGSVDAPRCFSMKLSQCTTQMCGMQAGSVDPELCMKHKELANGSKELVALMTKHVDDLKITGIESTVAWILDQIQSVFGKLKILWDDFTNCGVHHIHDVPRNILTLDQIDYAKNLRCIAHPELSSASSEAYCGEELHQMYMSLLGAVAYLYLTRMDLLVFISACQRHAHKPQIIHAKRLNVIVRWVQRNPKRLTYKGMKSANDTHLRIISDAAFKKEEEKGHSLRGAVYLRMEGSDAKAFTAGGVVHVLEQLCKAIRHVTRSTFSSELHGACDSVDLGILLCLMLHEIKTGVVSSTQARFMRERGGYCIPMTLEIDAMSVYAAITATFIKHPAEKGLLSHVQFVREMLDSGVLKALSWTDTRDMSADGLTKGAVDRQALHSIMDGLISYAHNATRKMWQSKMTATQDQMLHELPITDKIENTGKSAILSETHKFGGHVITGEVTLFCFAVGLGSSMGSCLGTDTSAMADQHRTEESHTSGTDTQTWLETATITRDRYQYASNGFAGRSKYISVPVGQDANAPPWGAAPECRRPADAVNLLPSVPVPSGHWPKPQDNSWFVTHTYRENWKKFQLYITTCGDNAYTSRAGGDFDVFFKLQAEKYFHMADSETWTWHEGGTGYGWPSALASPSIEWNGMCINCGIPIFGHSCQENARYCCHKCMYTNGCCGQHDEACNYHTLMAEGMTAFHELMFLSGACYRLVRFYKEDLAGLDAIFNDTERDTEDPFHAICNKVSTHEYGLSPVQLEKQQLCPLPPQFAALASVPSIKPSKATIMRFVLQRSVLHMHNVDWTNPLLYVQVPVPQLGAGSFYRFIGRQVEALIAAIAEPGPVGACHVLAANVYMASVLETRNRPLDPCLAFTLAHVDGQEILSIDHNIMMYVKSTYVRPATREQKRELYPTQTGESHCDVVTDEVKYLFDQPMEPSDEVTESNCEFNMEQMRMSYNHPNADSEWNSSIALKCVIRPEFNPWPPEQFGFSYPEIRRSLVARSNSMLGDIFGLELPWSVIKKDPPTVRVSWPMFTSRVTPGAHFATFYEYNEPYNCIWPFTVDLPAYSALSRGENTSRPQDMIDIQNRRPAHQSASSPPPPETPIGRIWSWAHDDDGPNAPPAGGADPMETNEESEQTSELRRMLTELMGIYPSDADMETDIRTAARALAEFQALGRETRQRINDLVPGEEMDVSLEELAAVGDPDGPPPDDDRVIFLEPLSERGTVFRFDKFEASRDLCTEKERLENALAENSWVTEAQGSYMFGDFGPASDISASEASEENVFTRHPNLKYRECERYIERLTSDIAFMSDRFYEHSDQQHYLVNAAITQFANCNCNLSLEDMIDIQSRQADQTVFPKPAQAHHVWPRISTYVGEIQTVGNEPNSAFYWPRNDSGYVRSIVYGFVERPAGVCHSVVSIKPLPDRIYQAYHQDPNSLVIRYYGCPPADAASIAHQGVRASCGVGAAELQDCWGFICTGSHWTTEFATALKYPMDVLDHTGKLAGFQVSRDGCLPQRLVVSAVCIKSDYLHALPGQELYPIDCPHILAFTWVACGAGRISTTQQEWCEVFMDVEPEDLRQYMNFATCSNGRLQYTGIQSSVPHANRFSEALRATLPPTEVEYEDEYFNACNSKSDMNRFSLALKVRRDYICSMTDDHLTLFSDELADQLRKIRTEGPSWPPPSSETYHYKQFFMEDLKWDRSPDYHVLASLDPVKLAKYEAECINRDHDNPRFSFLTCEEHLRDRAFAACVFETMPYVDMCDAKLLMHFRRDFKTMNYLENKTRHEIALQGMDLMHLTVEEICCKSSPLGVLAEGMLSMHSNFSTIRLDDMREDTNWRQRRGQVFSRAELAAREVGYRAARGRNIDHWIRLSMVGWFPLPEDADPYREFQGCPRIPTEIRADNYFPPYVSEDLSRALPYNPTLLLPVGTEMRNVTPFTMQERLIFDASPERRASWLSQMFVTQGLYAPWTDDLLLNYGISAADLEREYKICDFGLHEVQQMIHAGTWSQNDRIHEPRYTINRMLVAFGGQHSRFSIVAAPLDGYVQRYERVISRAFFHPNGRAVCSVCSRCPKTCMCNEDNDLPGAQAESPEVRYDLNLYRNDDTNLQHREMRYNNKYKSTASVWCPSRISPWSFSSSESILQITQAQPADNGGAQTRMSIDNYPVAAPVFPENAIAHTFLGPIVRYVGKGFNRMNSSPVEPVDFEFMTPAQQGRINRKDMRNGLLIELLHNMRHLEERETDEVRLSGPSHAEMLMGDRMARPRHSELFDTESAVLEAIQMRYIHADLSALFQQSILVIRNRLRNEILDHVAVRMRTDSFQWRQNKFVRILNAMNTGRLASDTGYTGGKFVSMTKMNRADRDRSGFPCRAVDLYGRPMSGPVADDPFGRFQSDPSDTVPGVNFATHASVHHAPPCDVLTETEQEHVSHAMGLSLGIDDLGIRYWYPSDQPDLIENRQYLFERPNPDQRLVLPKPFGNNIIPPHGTVDYHAARPQEVRIYIRPMMTRNGYVYLPLPSVHDRSFEEHRWESMEHQIRGKGHSKGNSRPSSSVEHQRGNGAPPAGGASRDGSGSSSSARPPAAHPTPTSAPNAVRQANTGSLPPQPKRMPKSRNKQSTRSAASSSVAPIAEDSDSNMD